MATDRVRFTVGCDQFVLGQQQPGQFTAQPPGAIQQNPIRTDMSLSSRHVARGDRNTAVAGRHVRSQILATQPCRPVQTEIAFSQYFQLGCGGQLGSQSRVHTDHPRMFHNPGQRRQQLRMVIGYGLRKPLKVTSRHTIRREGRFTLVATSPATGPLGLGRRRHQVQRSRHRQIVIPTNSGCPWMSSHQLQHTLDCSPGIGTAVNQVAKKDHPAIAKIFSPCQPIHQPVQQIDLPVHVTDQDHRTIDPGGKPLSLGDGTVSRNGHLLASAHAGGTGMDRCPASGTLHSTAIYSAPRPPGKIGLRPQPAV